MLILTLSVAFDTHTSEALKSGGVNPNKRPKQSGYKLKRCFNWGHIVEAVEGGSSCYTLVFFWQHSAAKIPLRKKSASFLGRNFRSSFETPPKHQCNWSKKTRQNMQMVHDSTFEKNTQEVDQTDCSACSACSPAVVGQEKGLG